ncbi:MAG: hypothetical protein QG608_3888 [Actinomycetota bacterium]|nr:hypothetical protein [Actinomycetota bacterium]
MPKILAAGLFVASLINPSASVPGVPSGGTTAVPPKIPVTVTMVTANGTGCPGGTTAVVPYPDGTGLHVIYTDYGVRDGAGVPLTEARKNCQVSLQVRAPSGFTYAVSRASYRGHADLVPGTVGTLRSEYRFAGMPQTDIHRHTFTEPFEGPWSVVEVPSADSLQFAPCGENRILNLNTELRVRNGSAAGGQVSFLVMDSATTGSSSDYEFEWKTCP